MIDTEQLEAVLSDIYQETLGFASFDAEMVIEQIIFCPMDGEDESIELARTRHPFIAAAIIRGGRPTNRYAITINPVAGSIGVCAYMENEKVQDEKRGG